MWKDILNYRWTIFSVKIIINTPEGLHVVSRFRQFGQYKYGEQSTCFLVIIYKCQYNRCCYCKSPSIQRWNGFILNKNSTFLRVFLFPVCPWLREVTTNPILQTCCFVCDCLTLRMGHSGQRSFLQGAQLFNLTIFIHPTSPHAQIVSRWCSSIYPFAS